MKKPLTVFSRLSLRAIAITSSRKDEIVDHHLCCSTSPRTAPAGRGLLLELRKSSAASSIWFARRIMSAVDFSSSAEYAHRLVDRLVVLAKPYVMRLPGAISRPSGEMKYLQQGGVPGNFGQRRWNGKSLSRLLIAQEGRT